MRLLVAGGLGFIGSHFVRAAVGDASVSSVKVLDSMTYAADISRISDLANDIDIENGEIGDLGKLQSYVGKIDVIVNFAAETHNDRSIENPSVFLATNVIQLANLATFCARNSIRLHHVSTDEIFGDTPLDSLETFNLKSPLRPSSPYSASKAAGDLILRAWARTFGLELSISNCSNNFGRGQHSEKFLPTAVRHLLSGRPVPLYGHGGNIRDWIRAEDHALGILAILKSGKQGTFLFGADDRVSNLEIVLALAARLNYQGQPHEFVQDRPGHDQRYAIDATATMSELNWKPSYPRILNSIDEILSWGEISPLGEKD